VWRDVASFDPAGDIGEYVEAKHADGGQCRLRGMSDGSHELQQEVIDKPVQRITDRRPAPRSWADRFNASAANYWKDRIL
jgi:hypothetical protein